MGRTGRRAQTMSPSESGRGGRTGTGTSATGRGGAARFSAGGGGTGSSTGDGGPASVRSSDDAPLRVLADEAESVGEPASLTSSKDARLAIETVSEERSPMEERKESRFCCAGRWPTKTGSVAPLPKEDMWGAFGAL